MEERLLTTAEVKEYFKIRDSRTINKFIKQGLKVIPIGTKDFRFAKKDVEEFTEHLKELAQEDIIQKYPIKRKAKCKTMHVDFEKIRINRELNKVV